MCDCGQCQGPSRPVARRRSRSCSHVCAPCTGRSNPGLSWFCRSGPKSAPGRPDRSAGAPRTRDPSSLAGIQHCPGDRGHQCTPRAGGWRMVPARGGHGLPERRRRASTRREADVHALRARAADWINTSARTNSWSSVPPKRGGGRVWVERNKGGGRCLTPNRGRGVGYSERRERYVQQSKCSNVSTTTLGAHSHQVPTVCVQ